MTSLPPGTASTAPAGPAAGVEETITLPRAEYRRLLDVATDLSRETSDPGTEALAAIWCAERLLDQAALTAPVPAGEGESADGSRIIAGLREAVDVKNGDDQPARVHVRPTAPPATAPAGVAEARDWSKFEDDISDAISDSMDMDWTSRDGAKAVVRLLNKLEAGE